MNLNAQPPSNIQIVSKTFDNYMRARQRAETQAKLQVDKLNTKAILRVKKEKLAEKNLKEQDIIRIHNQGQSKEKTQAVRKNYENIQRQEFSKAHQYYVENMREVDQRKQRSIEKDKEISNRVFNKAIEQYNH